MAQPFASGTWIRRSNIPGIILNGVYSGAVQGPIHAVYDPSTRTVQSFSQQAHHFRGFVNTAQISFNDGATWATSFNESDGTVEGDTEQLNRNETCITGWSIPNPSGVGSLHFQIRVAWEKAFLIADGSVSPGGISLWASGGGSAFFKLQTLHSWPAINEIGGGGGAAEFNTNPSITPPILLEGSGPDGQDAYWLISAYSFDAGGAGNRTTFEAATLWRSLDGIAWEAVRDMAPVTGVFRYEQIVRSTSGRLVVVGGGSSGIFWTDGDLLTGAFTASVFDGVPGIRGPLMEMYGGTFFTFSQGTLTGPGSAWISCDDCVNFQGSDALIPQNNSGHGTKLGPTELLVVAPGFSDPTTETCAYYSANGGEDFQISEPWLVSGTGESPVMLAVRSNGTPLVVARGGGVFLSGDRARGIAGERTICPLANAGLAAARPLVICGHPLTNNLCEDH